ncbi:MAG: RsmE family RNA methyltransferase [Oscillospiraceae bacterium]
MCRIIPVLTRRCISRPDKKAMEKKRQRLQKIALEAAKQSGRGIIPQVGSLLGWGEALEQLAQSECPVLFYESQGTTLRELMAPMPREVSILIGSEGGFDPQEVEEAARRGIQIVNLGPRILRCETAPLCALSAILYATGNLE